MGRKRGATITKTSWEIFTGTTQALAAGSAAVEIRAGIAGIGGAQTETLLRTRGHLVAWLDATPVPGDLIQVSVGFRLASEGSGATVTVSPFSQGGYPWFFHETFHLGYDELVADVIGQEGLAMIRIPINDKAMRIIRPDNEIQMVVENTTINTAQACNVSVAGRWLFGS